MTAFLDVFTKAVGEELYPGTLNVEIDRKILIQEDFRISGAEIGEPSQNPFLRIAYSTASRHSESALTTFPPDKVDMEIMFLKSRAQRTLRMPNLVLKSK